MSALWKKETIAYAMTNHEMTDLAEIADQAVKHFKPMPGSLVMEVGFYRIGEKFRLLVLLNHAQYGYSLIQCYGSRKFLSFKRKLATSEIMPKPGGSKDGDPVWGFDNMKTFTTHSHLANFLGKSFTGLLEKGERPQLNTHVSDLLVQMVHLDVVEESAHEVVGGGIPVSAPPKQDTSAWAGEW